MSDYTKGQIYKIVDSGFTKCYIGSAVQKLSYRMAGHRRDYNRYLSGKFPYNNSIFNLFDEFGVENCKIVWIEDFPCNSKKELEAREGKHQKETDCVNKVIAGRTLEEYYQDNKEKINKANQEYYYNNRERTIARNMESYYNNKEVRNEQNKERNKIYRIENLDKVRERDRLSKQKNKATYQRPWTCDCGLTIQFCNKSKHLKSKMHQQYLQSLEQSNPQE